MAVFAGMLIATILGVLIVPGLYVMIENIGKKKEEVVATENNVNSKTTDHE
jgi:HAE1 family hydrophobic/amphiphilic exporter-1